MQPDASYKFQRLMIPDLPVILSNDEEYKKFFIWMLIENYKTLQGHLTSKNSKEACERYINDNNPILGYIEERIEKVNGEQCKEVYADYMGYCLANNIKVLSNVAFSKLMKFNDFTQEADRARKFFWVNIKLKDNVDMVNSYLVFLSVFFVLLYSVLKNCRCMQVYFPKLFIFFYFNLLKFLKSLGKYTCIHLHL